MSERFQQLIDVAGPVSRETFESLLTFEALFRKWAGRINLAAESTLPDLWRRHVLDSAQLCGLAPDVRRWADFGSGGGFPGAVMAVLMREAGGHVDLVESNGKKAAFLQNALIGMPAAVHCLRIEDTYGRFSMPEIVTARALAPMPRLLTWLSPWLIAGARGFFHKGRDFRREVEESAAGWSFDLVEHRSAVEPESVILEVRNLRAKTKASGDIMPRAARAHDEEAPPNHHGRQPEGRRRQDNDGDQSGHCACRHRRAGADRGLGSAGQCQHGPRH